MAQPANSIAVANPGAKPNGDCRQIELNNGTNRNRTYQIFLYADDQEINLEQKDWKKLTDSINPIFKTTILAGVVEFEIDLEPSINKSTNELIYRASNYQFRRVDGTIVADKKIEDAYKNIVDKIAGIFSQLHLKIPNLSLPSLDRKGSEYQLMPQVPKKTTAFSQPIQPKPEVNNVAKPVFDQATREILFKTIKNLISHKKKHEHYGAWIIKIHHELNALKSFDKLVETPCSYKDQIENLLADNELTAFYSDELLQSDLLTYYLEYLTEVKDYVPSKNILEGLI